MPESGVIAAYLAELRTALRVGRRYRDRVIAETEEHLRESADHRRAGGAEPVAAERAAISDFGPVPALAAAFHRRAASHTVRTLLLVAGIAGCLEVAAQALGSPLFWHVAGGGVRPAGPWPYQVKGGLILAADIRAAADVVALVAIALAGTRLARNRRRADGPDWVTAAFGLIAAVSLGGAALTGLGELGIAAGFGPAGAQLAVVTGLLVAAGVLSGGAVATTGWRLWVLRRGWLPAGGLVGDLRAMWARLSPRAQGALVRGLAVLGPAVLAATFAAGLVESTRQSNLRSDANNPQQAVASGAAHLLAAGSDAATVAAGAQVDLARSLDVHITVFDASGRVLASTARLDGRTPVPPAGVLRIAARRTDVVTWQPRPAVRVAAVAMAWSGPAGRGTIVVGRSLAEVERRESRLLRQVALWWLVAVAASLLVAGAAAWWRPGPPDAERRSLGTEPGVAAA